MIRRNSYQFPKTLVLDALLAIGLAASPAVPALAQISGTWKKTGNLKNDLTAPAAILLQNGQVLLAGGDSSSGLLASAELYNPANGQWTATGSMNTPGGGALTLLHNGQVLLTGADTELYNPSTGKWTVAASMGAARYGYTQILLPNGKVLLAGGYDRTCGTPPCPTLSSAELYDPSSGTWTSTSSMNTARSGHTATLLSNGLVLVAGGYGATSVLASAELYNAATGQWTTTGSMNTARGGQYAALLQNGQVLVLFGVFLVGTDPASTELYDPATGKWTVNGSTGATAQFGFSVTLLNTGKVLIAGGDNCFYPRPCQSVTTAEQYDPSVGASTSTGSMNVPREGHAAILLLNGQVLAAGGETQNNVGKVSMTNTAELYAP